MSRSANIREWFAEKNIKNGIIGIIERRNKTTKYTNYKLQTTNPY